MPLDLQALRYGWVVLAGFGFLTMGQAQATTNLRYGWRALESMGALTNSTIYQAGNTRKTVLAEDVIEIVLGTWERCLATQYQTNPAAYWVTPFDVVRTWYSNVYNSNSVSVYTNVVTNTIGWSIDRQLFLNLDTTIKGLVQHFIDSNTVSDGLSNMPLLTVTGLWASLGIGDGTNQFTRLPGWTNSITTNWLINYTSYWPSTNGTATNINYTSHYQQVVNYAQSWTATGGHVWVNYSNWPTEVIQETNEPTFWPNAIPRQIYAEDLIERYKVLEALRYRVGDTVKAGIRVAGTSYSHIASQWGSVAFTDGDSQGVVEYEPAVWIDTIGGGPLEIDKVRLRFPYGLGTNVEYIAHFSGVVSLNYNYTNPPGWGYESEFMSFEAPASLGTLFTIISTNQPLTVGDSTNIPPDPGPQNPEWIRSWQVWQYRNFIDFQFKYCTNKYW